MNLLRLGFTCSVNPCVPRSVRVLPLLRRLHLQRVTQLLWTTDRKSVLSFKGIFPCTTSRFLSTISTTSPVTMSESPDTYRLPTDVKPTHYEVTVRTDLEKLVFDGFVYVQ
jgi:hypothetical protein